MKGKGKIIANIKHRIIRMLGGYTEPPFPPAKIEFLRTEVQPVTFTVMLTGELGGPLEHMACERLVEDLMERNCIRLERIPNMYLRDQYPGTCPGTIKATIRVIPPQYYNDMPEHVLTDQEIEDFRNEASRITQVPREMLFGKEVKDDEVKRDE